MLPFLRLEPPRAWCFDGTRMTQISQMPQTKNHERRGVRHADAVAIPGKRREAARYRAETASPSSCMRLVTLISSLAGLVLAGAVPSAASAQTIAGIVIDAASRLPLRQVDVHVLGDSGRYVADARTDTAGIFYAMMTTGGSYRLRFMLDSTTWFDSDTVRVASDGYVERQFVVRLPRAYFEFEVEKQVQQRSGAALLRYPPALRSANIEGTVLIQFVVDTTGVADMRTFKVLKASHADFVKAVRDALPRMTFYPAEIGGHKVKQMIQQPFDFRLSPAPLPSTDDHPTNPLFPSRRPQNPWP